MTTAAGAALIGLAILSLGGGGEAAAEPQSGHAAMAMPGAAPGAMPMRPPLPPMPAIYKGQADRIGAPVFKDLGRHTHLISTRNPESQRFFDQGVNLLFAFNHAEAIRSFREAARLDPKCAMCWWGVAYALGPNINLAMQPDATAPAWEALQRAQALAAAATPDERAWFEALGARYSRDPKADRAALDAAFAEAMGRLWSAHPNDLDAGTFYAEAMMDTQPWDYWQADAETPKGNGAQIIAVLEELMRRAPDHPGPLHLYIHAVEASTTPERAEAAADRLSDLMPAAGHIVHMPSHIYQRVGRYADAAEANVRAALVDEAYIASCRSQGFYPVGYYGHNIHFLWFATEMEGRYQASIDAARRLERAVDRQIVAEAYPQGELYGFVPVVTLLRFGKWRDVLLEPAPPPELTLNMAVWTYAQGFAHANTGDLDAAKRDRAALAAMTSADYSRFDPVTVPARQMVALSLALLDGEIARLSGDPNGAVANFRRAAEIEAALPYTEPAYWHQPVSHLLGAALLESGRAADAEAVYRRSLRVYRRDGWALHGLVRALEAQNKQREAREARKQLAQAWAAADVALKTSRL